MAYYKLVQNEQEARQQLKNLILLLTRTSPDLQAIMDRLPGVSGPTITVLLSELAQEGKIEVSESPPG